MKVIRIIILRLIFILLIVQTLSSCMSSKYLDDISLDDAVIMLNENNRSKHNEKYIMNIDGAGCLETLVFLLKEAPNEASEFSVGYHDVAEGYRFLNENMTRMDSNTKEIYLMALKMKNDTLCSKLKYSGLKAMKDKMKIQ